MNSVARALELDESRGFMKVIVDADTEQILGAAVLGIEGGEIMAMLQLSMMGKLKYSTLRDGVFAHPTLAESLNNLFGNFEDGLRNNHVLEYFHRRCIGGSTASAVHLRSASRPGFSR